jgi:hypothetical protein
MEQPVGSKQKTEPGSFLGSLLKPENGGTTFIRNVDELADYMTLQTSNLHRH